MKATALILLACTISASAKDLKAPLPEKLFQAKTVYIDNPSGQSVFLNTAQVTAAMRMPVNDGHPRRQKLRSCMPSKAPATSTSLSATARPTPLFKAQLRVISHKWPPQPRKLRHGLLCFMWLMNFGGKSSSVAAGSCYGTDLSIAMRRPYK